MLRYIIKRLVLSIPMLIAISFFACVMTRFIPGDPGRMMLGERATKEAIEKVKEEYGLNDPVHIQYFRFLSRVARGDFGDSIQSGERIVNEIGTYLPATIELTLAAMTLGTTLGIIVGSDLREAVERHRGFIQAEVLATKLVFGELGESAYREDVDIQNHPLTLHLEKE